MKAFRPLIAVGPAIILACCSGESRLALFPRDIGKLQCTFENNPTEDSADLVQVVVRIEPIPDDGGGNLKGVEIKRRAESVEVPIQLIESTPLIVIEEFPKQIDLVAETDRRFAIAFINGDGGGIHRVIFVFNFDQGIIERRIYGRGLDAAYSTTFDIVKKTIVENEKNGRIESIKILEDLSSGARN
jgi:hypothetical protein